MDRSIWYLTDMCEAFYFHVSEVLEFFSANYKAFHIFTVHSHSEIHQTPFLLYQPILTTEPAYTVS